MLENKVHLLDVSYVFQHAFYCQVYNRSLRFIYYKATMAKEKEYLRMQNVQKLNKLMKMAQRWLIPRRDPIKDMTNSL